jgi:tRNA-Thr(GGU) m(6)t(6)A37 methyltransferase TsaA
MARSLGVTMPTETPIKYQDATMTSITLTPIGHVHSPRTEVKDDFWGNVTSVIELDANHFTPESLLGLADFSHILVVYHLHNVPDASVVTTASHPRENPDWPRVGIFAQRKKHRPNKLGVSVCELIEVNGLKLKVKALDAIDGTPVLDIKPYVREFEPDPSQVRQPPWMTELMRNYFS